ncbi:MAG: hypothetical protein U5N85_02345 [Arcicella sp.]|nr:hypothetical protein [Arcicella sp.]
MKQIITFILCIITFNTFAQKQNDDVVYLKNGSIYRGKITEKTEQIVKLETYDKNTFSVQLSDIQEIKQEESLKKPAIQYKEKGYVHYTELGPLAGSNRASNGVTTSAFSFQTVNGYKFNQYLFTGIGIGADLYAVQTFVPIVLSIRGDLTQKGNKIPFYFVEGGYSINATSNDVDGIKYQGGSSFAAGLGLKILFNENTGFVIGAGYRFQRSELLEKGNNHD